MEEGVDDSISGMVKETYKYQAENVLDSLQIVLIPRFRRIYMNGDLDKIAGHEILSSRMINKHLMDACIKFDAKCPPPQMKAWLFDEELTAYKEGYDTFERTREEQMKNQQKAFDSTAKAKAHMQGAGKSAVLNSLIGHPVLPTGENGPTLAPISIDPQRDGSLSTKSSIVLQIDNQSQQVSASALRHSLQDRLRKSAASKGRVDEIYLKIPTSTAPPLKLVKLPGLDQRMMEDALVSDYAGHNDAILLVVIPASQAPEISSSKALRLIKEFDSDGTRTVGVISKIDQASSDAKVLAAVQALLNNQGPRNTSDIPWVALIGQSVSIASAQSGSVGSENCLETVWRADSEILKSILTGAPQRKLGRVALVETLARQIRNHMKIRLPNLLSGLRSKSQVVEDEIVSLGEQMVDSPEGTRAIALELCREFEDRYLQHIATCEAIERLGSGTVDEVIMNPGYKFQFPTLDDRPGAPIISFSGASFGYPGGPLLFKNLNFRINLDSRIAMVGLSGIASTILKLISGKLQLSSRTVICSAKVGIAAFSQHHVDRLDLTSNTLLYMIRCYPGLPKQRLPSHCGSLDVTGNFALQRIYTSTGGQKSRFGFAKITFKKPHIILLDEPSNHLDSDAVEALIQCLVLFQGGLMVSKLAPFGELWAVSDGKITPFAGDFQDYKKMLKSST